MNTTIRTLDALTNIEAGKFEGLIAWYLRETYPHLKGLISTGINDKGKPIACPVDGVKYVAGSPPIYFSVAATTEQQKNLSSKWLGVRNRTGDIEKAAKAFL